MIAPESLIKSEVFIAKAPKKNTENGGKQETVSEFANRTLLVKGFPPFWADKQLRKFMAKQNIEYEEARTFRKSPKFWITFQSLEEKEKAREMLHGMIAQTRYKKKLSCQNAEQDGNWMDQIGKKRLRDDSDEIQRPAKKMKIEDLKEPSQVLTPWLEIDYDQQCLKKWRTVRKAMQKMIKGLNKETPYQYKWMETESVSHPVGCLASPVTESYRNKDSFTIGKSFTGETAIGCRLGSTKDGCVAIGNVMEVKHLHPVSKHLVKTMDMLLKSSPFPPYDRTAHTGVWRSLLNRTAHQGKEALVVVLVQMTGLSDEQKQSIHEQVKTSFLAQTEHIQKEFGFSLVGVLLQDYEGLSDVVPVDHPYTVLHGRSWLVESLSGLDFQISFQSFFQINVPQAERMFEIAGEWAAASENTVLFDVCCGAGTIGLTLAKYVKHVVGLEIIPEAVKDAERNKEINGITNCEFICGKAEHTIEEALAKYQGSDVVAIVDPPRSGLHPDVLKTIRTTEEIDRLVYISCNPTTCAQNCISLCRGKTKKFQGAPFKPVKSIAIDMFPHTPHTEMIVLLERAKSADVIRDDSKKLTYKKQRNWKGKGK